MDEMVGGDQSGVIGEQGWTGVALGGVTKAQCWLESEGKFFLKSLV